MKISEPEVEALDLTSATDFTKLIVGSFCTKPDANSTAIVTELIQQFLDSANRRGLNYEQFNEALLLLKQNRVSRAFFTYFFGDGTITLDQLRAGVVKFRGLAMLSYGNFTYARRTLTRKESVQAIESCLRGFAVAPEKRRATFTGRPEPIVDIEPISRCATWLNGEITGRVIKNEAIAVSCRLSEPLDPSTRGDVERYAETLVRLDRVSQDTQRKALRNTDVYLTWDYLDVYVATSMRNKWEYEETFDFIDDVFVNNESVRQLKLRFFDPTQCKCSNARDKGLIEGLMLSRALCTIYMAQEGDTLGKDSELAATLAQGKPVIVYVPSHSAESYAAKIADYPLDYFKKRLLTLQAEGILIEPECREQLERRDAHYEETLNRFLVSLDEYRDQQPLSLAADLDSAFKLRHPEFTEVCQLVAIAETFNFERRSHLLRGRHPLSMQVDLNTGIANGVLVVRSTEQCATVLCGLLTNDLDLEVSRDPEHDDFTILLERESRSPFRIVTHNERLTNAFWNLFGERSEQRLAEA